MASLATRTIWSHSHQFHACVFHPHIFNFSTIFLPLPSHLFFFPSSINRSCSSPIHLRRSFCGSLSSHSRSFSRCHAGTSGPPPSPPGDEPHPKGITSTISRFWDTLQIFVAVFIWMSLFFWASASDRKNTGGRN